MENLSLLKDGAVIMFLGMGFVFLFLVIMVYSMQIMSAVIKKINKFFPEAIPEENKYTKKSQNTSDSEIALAIALAFAKKKEEI